MLLKKYFYITIFILKIEFIFELHSSHIFLLLLL